MLSKNKRSKSPKQTIPSEMTKILLKPAKKLLWTKMTPMKLISSKKIYKTLRSQGLSTGRRKMLYLGRIEI